MVVIKVLCENPEEKTRLRDNFNNGLVGSPGFQSNEILVGDDPENENNFYFLVGNNNENDFELKVKSSDLSLIKAIKEI